MTLPRELLSYRDEHGYCRVCGYLPGHAHIEAVGHADTCLLYRAATRIEALYTVILGDDAPDA